MTDVRLGARLALAGGFGRAALTAAGNAIGTAVLLLATAVPQAVFGGDGATAGDRRIGTALALVLSLPVVVLLASTTRLAAAVRDRRLAALRLLGVDTSRTARIAALEALMLAAAGVAAGVCFFAAVARPAVQALDSGWRQWFEGRLLDPPRTGWALALLGVPLLAVLVSLAPIRAVARSPLAVRRSASTSRPGWWRLLPVALGTVQLAVLAARPTPAGTRITQGSIALLIGGIGLLALGLPLLVPIVVRLAADGGARLARGVTGLITARRLQQEPAATTRLVAVLLVGLLLMIGGLSALTPFERSPDYLRALHATTTGPQWADVLAGPTGVIDASRVRAAPGVLGLVPRHPVGLPCTAGAGTVCGSVFIGSCADLAAFSSGIAGCRDDRPAWLRRAGTPGDVRPRAARLLVDPDDQAAGKLAGRTAQIAVRDVIDVRIDPGDPQWVPDEALFVPAGTPDIAPLLATPQRWQAALAGGSEPVAALTAAAGPGAQVLTADTGVLDTVGGYRAVLYAVIGVILAVCLVGLLIAGVDQAVQRRRHLAGLTLVGVRPTVVRRSQLLQALTPLAIGVPLAAAGGLLAGAAYLSLIGERGAIPWASAGVVTASALGAGLLVAAATVAGLGGPVRSTDLRRE